MGAQERIMKVPYGEEKEFFRHSLFIVLFNRLLTCSIAAIILLVQGKSMAPAAPVYKYAGVSISNVVATTCQYEALKYVSFPIQTLAKSGKMIPVMVWGTAIMQKKYGVKDYIIAATVTMGCAVFILAAGSLVAAIDFLVAHPQCLFNITLLSLGATTSQFFISYTIRTFGALVFATIMTTRQLLSILVSCMIYGPMLTAGQFAGTVFVFGALYYRAYTSSNQKKAAEREEQGGGSTPKELEPLLSTGGVGSIGGERTDDVTILVSPQGIVGGEKRVVAS
eukprot:jgi/Mesen1/3926/ME000209S02936